VLLTADYNYSQQKTVCPPQLSNNNIYW